MTISAEAIKTSVFDGNGSTTVFAFTFKTFLAADLVVTLTSSAGMEAVKTLTTHYTVALNSNQDSNPGGSVTMVTAPASGSPAEKLIISNSPAYTQGVDLVSGGAFNANVIEDAIDRNTILSRRANEEVGRSIKIPISDDAGTTVSLPTETLRADKAIVFSSTGSVGVSVDNYVDQVATVAASAAAAAASAAAALISEGLADADAIQVAADLVATNQDTIDTAADVATTTQDAIDTAADVVTTAANAAKLTGTSTTSLAIAVASKGFTTQASKFFTVGYWLLITSDADTTNYMHGQVTAYSGTSLTVNVTNIGGTGTFADWTISVSGTRGAIGSTGSTGLTGATGSTGAAGADGEATNGFVIAMAVAL